MKEEIKIIPKQKYIDGGAELLQKSEGMTDPYITEIDGGKFIVNPKVFNPDVFFSSKWFAKNIPNMVKGDKDFLEVGSGTGIVSVKVAESNPDLSVVSTDISPFATKNTLENIILHNLYDRIYVSSGDVFDGIRSLNRKFDTIFWSMPFSYLPPGTAISIQESQVHDPGYRAINKFFTEANEFLNIKGKLLIGFSSDIGHVELLHEFAKKNGFKLELKMLEKGKEKDVVNMEIWEARY